ncbi:MAG: hypothetical protein LBK61_12250 [Spirochaetaceae bacterium]|jgi:hypothetical protein|nr:hypothetical protein [Spirochaetaceae bacterium]
MDNTKDLFFDGGSETGAGSEEMLLKALTAGYGTDSAQFTGGRALIPEDCETTMVNAMREQREDCKIMNTFKKTPVKSTVHEYNRRTGTGDLEFGTTEEGGISHEDSQSIERVTRNVKYIQQYREVTEQMNVVDTFENALESEKLAGTLNILKIAERLCIHGDSDVVPTEFDGMIKQIKKTNSARRNIIDFRGGSIPNKGEKFFAEMTRMIREQGGMANKVFFPLILSDDIQILCRDRLRFGTNDHVMTPVFDSYPTPLGTVKFGEDAGPDKMFFVRGRVASKGDPLQKPNAPQSVTVAADDASGSKFAGGDAGNYIYKVFAINKYGISDGKSPAAAVAVASGDGVTITITPDGTKPGTGFIICRTAPGGTADQAMEMVRIAKSEDAATVYVDLNDDLPGTTDMIFITEQRLQAIAEFYQLLPMRLYRMNPVNRLVTPFILALWGVLDLKVPEWCGLTKNIAYQGGLYG